MKAILQEIVDQAGWSENNAIALLFYLPQVHSDSAVEGVSTPRDFRANFLIGKYASGDIADYANTEGSLAQPPANVAGAGIGIVGKQPKLLIGD